MSTFKKAFEITLANDGGYKLHKIPGDSGGLTYAGISKKFHPDWEGWKIPIDSPAMPHAVKRFYEEKFWDKIQGDHINNQLIANCIYDFAVNAGVSTAVRLAQYTICAKVDGIIGPITLRKLNHYQFIGVFIENYTFKKIQYYVEICNKIPRQKKFLLGWLNRALKYEKILSE